MEFSSYQQAIFEWVKNGSGNLLVQARAGSGKTFTALHAMNYMKGNVCSMTFNKKNASELSQKIVTMGLCNAQGTTFHAEGLKNYKKVVGNFQVDSNKLYNIIERYTMNPKLNSARGFIREIVSLAKQNGFGIKVTECNSMYDRDAWMKLANHHDISLDNENITYQDAIEIAIQVLEDSNKDFRCIDFDDMIYLTLLNDLKLIQYDWVIIDEAQDTNVIRKIMTKRMLKPEGRLMAIGDCSQAIYGFCGAENDSMNIIKQTFNCSELSLPVCYRCGANIIKHAQAIVPDIICHDKAEQGIVRYQEFNDFINQVNNYNLSKKDGIICRNNAPLIKLAFNLIGKGIGCRIEGRDIGKSLITICNKWKVKDLNTFNDRLHKFFSKEIERTLSPVKRDLLQDKYDTMLVLIERCQSLGKYDVQSLKNLIEGMFSNYDDKNIPDVVTLSSIHKAKGLEWKRCFTLGNNQFIPSKYAILPWQITQETNLKYIAITRAMQELVEVTNIPK